MIARNGAGVGDVRGIDVACALLNSPEMKDIAEIRLLPVPERLALVTEIWDSIMEESEALPLSEELCAELDRRLEEHRRAPETSRPWPEVRKEMFGDE